MSVFPPSLFHHHPKQECEEGEATVSRQPFQLCGKVGDVVGGFHGQSYSRTEQAGALPYSARLSHAGQRQARDLIIVYCGRPALLPDRNLAGDRASSFIRDHGGSSPVVTASARLTLLALWIDPEVTKTLEPDWDVGDA